MVYFTKGWLVGTAERAVKTAAQSALALLTVGEETADLDLDLLGVAGIAATAALISVLTSVADPRHADAAVATVEG